jgi:hypothetical protein
MLPKTRHTSSQKSAPQLEQVLTLALEYLESGLAVIPIRLDGSKSPSICWKPFQHRLPTSDEVRLMFSRLSGIGIPAGTVSGGLEILSFDQPECFAPWKSFVSKIVDRLPVIKTANAGFQVFFRCDRISKNTQLAAWEPPDAPSFAHAKSRRHCLNQPVQDTRIRTIGRGGYVVAVGSPACVDPTQVPYVQISGPAFPSIPKITVEERKLLWMHALEFNCNKLCVADNLPHTSPREQIDRPRPSDCS